MIVLVYETGTVDLCATALSRDYFGLNLVYINHKIFPI